MAKRPRPTLADYIVIGLSPALIMFLVGSLTFFLVAVFYQGQHGARLSFIMAMFVMAAVSIARISIQEGRGYAALFALPLGAVVLLAMFRFVQFSGPLAAVSPLINIGLIALVWWSADKLTWDCTVIDEQQDASGVGLLQTAGLDRGEADSATPDVDVEATTGRVEPEAASRSAWSRRQEQRRRPHAPGVWVVYFSLAALPIFGVGQWFIQADDLESRRYVFKLLVVYVASALGLLLTTSFLGLRRYLRQRRLEMPNEMAASWLGVGVVMIVGLLLFCLLLPRRNPEYSVTQLSWFANSRDDLWTSPWAFGNDGPEREDADRTVQRQDAQQTSSGSQNQAQQSGDGQEGGQQSGGQQSGGQKSGEQQAGGEKAEGQKSGQQQPGQQQSGQQQSGGQQSGDQQSGDQSSDNPSSDDPQQSGKQQSGKQQSGKQQSSKQPSGKQSAQNSQQAKNEPSNDGQPRDSGSQEAQRADDAAERAQSDASSRPQQSAKRSFDPSRMFSQLGSLFGGFLKLAYWLVVLLIVGFLLWRYREQVRAAIQQFLQALREFWERLFGRRVETHAEDEAGHAAAAPAGPPFSDFRDPFQSGLATRMSVDELVDYSFRAFEAWSRDHGRPRDPDETPLEFAEAIARDVRPLAREATTLAELYNWSAYGGGGLPRSALDHLARFWQRLTAVDRQPAEPHV